MVRWRAGSEAMRWATEPRDLTGATSGKDQGEGCAEVANSAHSLADNASHATSNTIAAYRRDEFLESAACPHFGVCDLLGGNSAVRLNHRDAGRAGS